MVFSVIKIIISIDSLKVNIMYMPHHLLVVCGIINEYV